VVVTTTSPLQWGCHHPKNPLAAERDQYQNRFQLSGPKRSSRTSCRLANGVPIIPSGPRQPRPALASIPKKGAPAPTSLDPARIAEAVDSHNIGGDPATPTTRSATTSSTEKTSAAAAVAASETPGHKLSRRERILHLARQNARTPLPEPVEVSQPPPPTDAKGVDGEESERHVKERTIRERLWRLVGGNY